MDLDSMKEESSKESKEVSDIQIPKLFDEILNIFNGKTTKLDIIYQEKLDGLVEEPKKYKVDLALKYYISYVVALLYEDIVKNEDKFDDVISIENLLSYIDNSKISLLFKLVLSKNISKDNSKETIYESKFSEGKFLDDFENEDTATLFDITINTFIDNIMDIMSEGYLFVKKINKGELFKIFVTCTKIYNVNNNDKYTSVFKNETIIEYAKKLLDISDKIKLSKKKK